MRGRMSGARTLYRCNDSFFSSVEKMAHFITKVGRCTRRSVGLSRATSETSERLPGRRRHPGILPKLFYAASNKSGHFLIVNRSVPAFVVTLTIASKRKTQRS